MRPSRPAIILTVAALALGLTGCLGNPVEGLVEGVIENQTGIDVDTQTDGTSASLPKDWPGLPVPAGTITSALSTSGVFSISVTVESEDEIERVIAELLGQGYEETARADLGGLKTVVVTGPEWVASFGWFPDEENGGFFLNYGVGENKG